MASILIASTPIHGHVVPLLTVAAHLVERGDRVRVITGSRFAAKVEATGAELVPLPTEIDFDDRQDWNQTFPERASLKGSKAVAFDIEHIFIGPARAQHAALAAAHAREPADAALLDPAYAGGALLLGQGAATRPPVIVCGILPLTLSSRDTAPVGMGLPPFPGPIGRMRNAVLAMLVGRLVLDRADALAAEQYRDVHGGAMPFAVMDWMRHAEAIAQFTVEEFEYPRSDAPATLHFTGPISASGSAAPLPEWWTDLDGSRPVVHVTQGTIANKDYRQIIRPALEGLAHEDVLVVVSTGGRPVDTLPPLPANARAAEFLPYDDLLPLTDVYVTNGGYGGVQYALKHGLPIVTSGGQEDKPEVAARVAWSGVGLRVKGENPSPAAVRKAVLAVLEDPRYREAAGRVASSMERSGGLPQLATLVDALIERRAT
ncbi:glycosyltransferase [Demequina iriomotensis]|uniref:glycosyltransferase n=1 Tax=Demequina iriomotensis TaxID=1536641 RepID=UPI00078562A1|nr:glycosyltransferase [Demequina iriomotensis]